MLASLEYHPNGEGDPSVKKVYVGNLSFRVTEEELRAEFENAGIKTDSIASRRSRETVINATDLGQYKQLLLAKGRELSATRVQGSTPVPAAGDPGGDLIDKANAHAEAELQLCLHQSYGRLLRAIEGALARIERGTYGVCERCRQPIASARLKAVPWAHHCRYCKESENA